MWLAGMLVACGGDDGGGDSSSLAECTVVTVDVDVTDPDGNPETGATVELEGGSCAEVGDGAYTCTAPAAGPAHLTVHATDPLLAVYTTLLTLPEPSCTPVPVSVDLVKSAV